MMRRCFAPCLALAIALTVTACVTAPPLQYPVGAESAATLLPWAETSAVLQVQNNSATTTYLLALRNSAGEVDLALLSPQGAPLYQWRDHRGEQALVRKLAAGSEPEPTMLMAQLQLMFAPQSRLGQALAGDWSFAQVRQQRVFTQTATGREITVNYQGSPPWYAVTRLIDSAHDTILTVRIQEQHDVLPQ